MQRTKVKCDICGREISKSNITKHLKSHENDQERLLKSNGKYKLNHDGLICQFCGKECKNRNSLCNHERLCKENPDRQNSIIVGFNDKGHKAWNKGLTKDTDDRVKRSSESVKTTVLDKISTGWVPAFATKEYWTEDRKKQQSEKRKKFLLENPEKHPNRILASNRKNYSYLENIVSKWLDDNDIKYERQFVYPFKDSNRYVDFYIKDYNLFIEVDGEYWHKNSIDIDTLKDELALNDGITTLRISSKENINNTLNNYFKNKI